MDGEVAGLGRTRLKLLSSAGILLQLIVIPQKGDLADEARCRNLDNLPLASQTPTQTRTVKAQKPKCVRSDTQK